VKLSNVALLFPMPWLTVIAMLLFVAVFVGILLWVFQPERKAIYENISKTPLSED
jgi:cbb3-type cytochrome oxidase subunit 3